MVSANAAALKVWSAESLDELLSRDFSHDMTGTTRARLATYLRALQSGQTIVEVWTLYPRGTPTALLCRCTPAILDDHRTGMQVEVIHECPELDDASLRYLVAMQHLPALVSVYDSRGQLVMRNARAMDAFGPGGVFGDYFEDPQAADALWQSILQDGGSSGGMQTSTVSGRRYHLIEAQLTRDPVSGRQLVVTYEQDDTERQNLTASLATANALLNELIDRLPIAILVEDEDRRVTTVNKAFCRMFDLGMPPQDLMGLDCQRLLDQAEDAAADADSFTARIETILAAQLPVSGEEVPLADGRLLTLSYQPIFVDGAYRGHFWQYEDVTGRRHTEETLRWDAQHDWLTGLPNRRSTDASLAARLARMHSDAASATVLLVDVDHFKAVNDLFGHHVGDQILIQVAQALQTVLRPSDIIGRFGGEEFLILLPETPIKEGRLVAERVRLAAADSGCKRPDGEPITVSVGATAMTAADPDTRAAIDRSDTALYEAKRAGRNRIAERLNP